MFLLDTQEPPDITPDACSPDESADIIAQSNVVLVGDVQILFPKNTQGSDVPNLRNRKRKSSQISAVDDDIDTVPVLKILHRTYQQLSSFTGIFSDYVTSDEASNAQL